MSYLIPGKTFLIGEYSALVGGSVLGLATKPGFTVNYGTQKEFKFPFPLQSPAGIQWQKNSELQFQFEDQIQVGGFGKSTAEYLSVLIPSLLKKSAKEIKANFHSIRDNYINDSETSGARVSGLDLAIQCFGSVTHYDAKINSYTASGWNFPTLDFLLISTGIKVKTHEHLQSLDLKKISHYSEISNAVVRLYFKNDPVEFITGLTEWTNFLISENRVHTNSLELRTALMKNPDILCAKPCGALGADVMLILVEAEKLQAMKHKISALGLSVMASSKDLIPGIFDQISSAQRGLNVG